MQDYLTRFPKIDVVWASDDMAAGVRRAIQPAKRTDVRRVLGGAGMKEMIQRVSKGEKLINANVSYVSHPPSMIADAMRLPLNQAVGGKAIAASTIIPSVLVTRANASKFSFPSSPF